MKFKKIILVFSLSSLVFGLIGCDAFVRKFTRKQKKENIQREELVLEPQEYKSNLTKEELYRRYLLYWNSWQAELIEALSNSSNHKKQLGCIEQALKNLVQLRSMLNAQKQQKLDVYLNQLKDLQNEIVKDVYGSSHLTNRTTAERLKMRILHDFSYDKIKDSLV